MAAIFVAVGCEQYYICWQGYLFNLLPTSVAENSKRGNQFFVADGADGYTPVADETKGIVARVVLNLAYRFAGCSSMNDACATNMLNYLSETPLGTKMGDYRVLVQWAGEYPETQRERNHYAELSGTGVSDENVNTFADISTWFAFAVKSGSLVPTSDCGGMRTLYRDNCGCPA